jgi:predicted nucleic acid-binding protein
MRVAAINRFVMDASATLAWCLPDEGVAEGDAILSLLTERGWEALVPAVWPFEVANGLLAAERKKRITPAQTTAILHRVAELPVFLEAVSIERLFDPVVAVARHEGLTEYDAAYLELAQREHLPLATFDQRLRKRARATGVELILI